MRASHLSNSQVLLCLVFRPNDRKYIARWLHRPPLRDLPKLRGDEAVGEEVGDMRRQTGISPSHFGAHGVKVDEPGLEERPRHRLKRLVQAPVELDLVVQRAQYVRDGALFGEGWDRYL